MILVDSIKQNSRGAGKGFSWAVSIQTPAVVGNINAKDYGIIASAEVIDLIRTRWGTGRRVDGEHAPYSRFQKARRRVEAYVIDNMGMTHSQYHAWLTDFVAELAAADLTKQKQKRENRYYRMFRVKEENFNKYKSNIQKNYRMTAPEGEIGKKPGKIQYYPDEARPALAGSLGMVFNLRGKLKPGRKANMNGKSVEIKSYIDLRLPKSRQYPARWKGGLTSGKVDGVAETFRYMPQSQEYMRNAIKWQQIGQRATNVFIMLRLAYKIVRVLA